MRKIDKIILHCTATTEGRDVSADEIRGWHKAQGWKDIGYHYVIRLNGEIEQGRPIEQVGAHCQGQNANSIGIVYVGGLSKYNNPEDTRTCGQRNAMEELVKEMKEKYPAATIHGHREFANKACPCFDVQEEYWVKQLTNQK